MWAIVEIEWHYNEIEDMQIYGPFRSEAKAKKVFDKLRLNRKSNITYEMRRLSKA
jgi:hypothetical protein